MKKLIIFFCLFQVLGCRHMQRATLTSKEANLSYSNPVLDSDFPDPTVIRANGKYYAYATQARVNGQELVIQVASSSDLQHWKIEGGALAQKPVWADNSFWAPHVLYDSILKKYVMFYSGESIDTTTGKCIGVAYSNDPMGPFIDKGTPLICGEGFVNIDPMAIKDPKTGKKLLYWGSGFQPIKVQELTDDWSEFKKGTEPKPVVWPGKEKSYTALIEGAWVNYHDGNYYLFYSGDNCCGDKANYAVMVARSKDPFGPFIRYGEENGTGSSVILEKDSVWLAPGHNSIFKDEKGNEWIAYHAIKRNEKTAGRVLCIERIVYKNGWPVVLR